MRLNPLQMFWAPLCVLACAGQVSATTIVMNLDANTIAGSTGTAVNSWSDAAHGITATANTSGPSSAPTLQTGALNGNSVVNFAGTHTAGQSMNVTVSPPVSQPYSVFLVGQTLGNDATNSTDYFFDGQSVRVALGLNSTGGNPNDLFAYADGGAAIDDFSKITGTGFHIFEVSFNGPNSKLYLDGTLVASGDPGSGAIGALFIGTRTNVQEFLNGAIATFRIYTDGNTALTDAERNAIGANLQSTYAIPGSYVAVPEPSTAVLSLLGIVGSVFLVKLRVSG